MFEYPVKIQATAAIPERRRGRETRDARRATRMLPLC